MKLVKINVSNVSASSIICMFSTASGAFCDYSEMQLLNGCHSFETVRLLLILLIPLSDLRVTKSSMMTPKR